MDASKENCVKAQEALARIELTFDSQVDRPHTQDEFDTRLLKEFLAACLKRLPSEAAIERSKNRKPRAKGERKPAAEPVPPSHFDEDKDS